MVAACGSSGSSAGGTGGSSASASPARTYTIGVLADVTGVGASTNKAVVDGVKAGVVLARRQGYTVKTVVADTGSSPAGALSGAQSLVRQSHVDGVVEATVFSFAASPYLKSNNVPVFGQATSPEWATNTNMFSVSGELYAEQANTAFGAFMKMQGVTRVGLLAYGVVPNSAQTVKAYATSAKAAGLDVAFQDTQLPLGTSGVQPAVLAMKDAKVEGVTAFVEADTGFAIIKNARQAGLDLKVPYLLTGYGGDLLDSGPGALQVAQNVYFATTMQPVEMNTAATRQFVADLRTAGLSAHPSYGEYTGYAALAMFADALKASGGDATPARLIAGLNTLHAFDAAGLLGQKIDLGQRGPTSKGVDNCVFVVKLVGKAFQLVKGAEPICGKPVG
ncbi:ABC transporter substrate-binding protein [Frankia sp. AgW1.1]|nr:ABC transporter substrate-binding protein [Frankia sp. AgW1.1]